MEKQPERIVVEEQAVVLILNNTGRGRTTNEIETVTVEREIQIPDEQKVTAKDGTVYYTIGQIYIPSINCQYPILSSETENFDTLLKIAPCKFHGANPNEIGNFCIVGHNYKNSQFFSKVPKMQNGDIIEITDNFGKLYNMKYMINILLLIQIQAVQHK